MQIFARCAIVVAERFGPAGVQIRKIAVTLLGALQCVAVADVVAGGMEASGPTDPQPARLPASTQPTLTQEAGTCCAIVDDGSPPGITLSDYSASDSKAAASSTRTGRPIVHAWIPRPLTNSKTSRISSIVAPYRRALRI